jgi:urease accessory protein
MQFAESVHVAGWNASLALDFARRGPRTVLAGRRHDGPLVVQKALYPEGEAVCHAIVVHPPAGVAGGDALALDARLGEGAHALLTTPGAGKWYRSAGPWAEQRIGFDVAPGACLEWLPQENIVFDGARATLSSEVRLAGDARFIGWEITCLGRTGSGERFTRGELRLATRVTRDGAPLWIERGTIAGGGALLRSPAGLAGQPVTGTLVATLAPDGELLSRLREAAPAAGGGAVTRLPGLLVARYLGASSEAARAYFAALWGLIRPALAGRAAAMPRIWRT